MSMGLEIGGVALSVLGWLCSIICCALPMWKVSAFIGNNIVTAQILWEGLWMSCVVQSTGQMQCKVYDSMLALPQDLQAARALLVVSIILAVLGLMVAIVGAQCTRCVEDESTKAKITIVAGVIFLLSGVMTLIPVCWSANTIIRDFYNPLVIEAQKRELGTSLYVGWAASALLMLGGGLLCCSCPPKDDRYPTGKVAYSAPRSAVTSPLRQRPSGAGPGTVGSAAAPLPPAPGSPLGVGPAVPCIPFRERSGREAAEEPLDAAGTLPARSPKSGAAGGAASRLPRPGAALGRGRPARPLPPARRHAPAGRDKGAGAAAGARSRSWGKRGRRRRVRG